MSVFGQGASSAPSMTMRVVNVPERHLKVLEAERDAYKWAYEYLQSRLESIQRGSWAHDCDGEIEFRIARAGQS